MKISDNESIKFEITGQAVLQILRMKINFSLQTLIKQLLLMKSVEENTLRRDLIDSIIHDFSNSDTGGANRRVPITDNKKIFNGKKINRIH
ncbi:two-component-system connector protein YmgA [Escherichia coli]|nr:two-component-system connector protein YmgA [Escherichia coli]